MRTDDGTDRSAANERSYCKNVDNEIYGLDTFLGTILQVDGELYGRLRFGTEAPRRAWLARQ